MESLSMVSRAHNVQRGSKIDGMGRVEAPILVGYLFGDRCHPRCNNLCIPLAHVDHYIDENATYAICGTLSLSNQTVRFVFWARFLGFSDLSSYGKALGLSYNRHRLLSHYVLQA